VGPDGTEFFYDVLVAAIDVIDPVDEGFAVGYQAGQDEGSASAQIAGDDGGAGERRGAAHYGAARNSRSLSAPGCSSYRSFHRARRIPQSRRGLPVPLAS